MRHNEIATPTKMNKKGDNDMLMENIIYLTIFIIFFLTMFWFVNSYSNRSAYYEEFYSKKIAGIINSAEPGMDFKIDITPLAIAASKNSKPIKDIILIDNVNNQIIVSSRPNSGTSFGFFNDVDVVNWYVESPSGRADTTQFIFTIKEKKRNEI